MLKNRSLAYLIAIMGLIILGIIATAPSLVPKIRFGLEFRGGYEIYYVVSPLPGKDILTGLPLNQWA